MGVQSQRKWPSRLVLHLKVSSPLPRIPALTFPTVQPNDSVNSSRPTRPWIPSTSKSRSQQGEQAGTQLPPATLRLGPNSRISRFILCRKGQMAGGWQGDYGTRGQGPRTCPAGRPLPSKTTARRMAAELWEDSSRGTAACQGAHGAPGGHRRPGTPRSPSPAPCLVHDPSLMLPRGVLATLRVLDTTATQPDVSDALVTSHVCAGERAPSLVPPGSASKSQRLPRATWGAGASRSAPPHPVHPGSLRAKPPRPPGP